MVAPPQGLSPEELLSEACEGGPSQHEQASLLPIAFIQMVGYSGILSCLLGEERKGSSSTVGLGLLESVARGFFWDGKLESKKGGDILVHVSLQNTSPPAPDTSPLLPGLYPQALFHPLCWLTSTPVQGQVLEGVTVATGVPDAGSEMVTGGLLCAES